jgi:hypothetical protein
MNAALLGKLFGQEQRWVGPCTVIMDAEAAVQSLGVDSIIGGGAKSYAPRMVSGRVAADAVCLTQNALALLIVQQHKVRLSTGEEKQQQTLIVADAANIVAIEFLDTAILASLGLTPPPAKLGGSQHGLSAKPG